MTGALGNLLRCGVAASAIDDDIESTARAMRGIFAIIHGAAAV
jgi:hypothetical protein